MRYLDKITIGLYLVLISVWIYWVLDRQLLYGSDLSGWPVIGVVGLAHVMFGFGVGRTWAVLLPLLAVLIAVPLGYPSANKGEPLPIWLGLLIWAPVYMLAVAIGTRARSGFDGRRSA
jgi:hypothetical protein